MQQPDETGRSNARAQIEANLSGSQRRMLKIYSHTGSVTQSCRAAGIARSTHYEWLQNENYRAAFDCAREEAFSVLEDEAMRRAVNGVKEPVYHNGKVVGHILKYSDTVLITLLRRKPEYARTDLTTGGRPIDALQDIISRHEAQTDGDRTKG